MDMPAHYAGRREEKDLRREMGIMNVPLVGVSNCMSALRNLSFLSGTHE
jgi:hypothetical protein